jgi:ABC-type multidrug transport system ATPase subunit
MGSSGCGKTTLINCIVGLNEVDAGRIKLFGKPLAKVQSFWFGYMPQETALVENFKIREMLRFFGTIYGLNSKECEKKNQILCDLLELPVVEMLIKNCSGGQKRRISFAVSLIHDPELLILDEPTVGLDPLLRGRIWDHLNTLTTVKNVTVFMSTHYIEEANQSHRIGLMRNGALIIEDSPDSIMNMCGTTDLEKAFLQLVHVQEVAGCQNAVVNSHFGDAALSRIETKLKKQQILLALLTKLFYVHIRSIR